MKLVKSWKLDEISINTFEYDSHAVLIHKIANEAIQNQSQHILIDNND